MAKMHFWKKLKNEAFAKKINLLKSSISQTQSQTDLKVVVSATFIIMV